MIEYDHLMFSGYNISFLETDFSLNAPNATPHLDVLPHVIGWLEQRCVITPEDLSLLVALFYDYTVDNFGWFSGSWGINPNVLFIPQNLSLFDESKKRTFLAAARKIVTREEVSDLLDILEEIKVDQMPAWSFVRERAYLHYNRLVLDEKSLTEFCSVAVKNRSIRPSTVKIVMRMLLDHAQDAFPPHPSRSSTRT